MDGVEVKLNDILLCRERRVHIQSNYIKMYHCPVISFCMNIPGPIKTNSSIRNAFEIGKHALLSWLNTEHISIADYIEFHDHTGDELIMSVHCSPEKLKEKSLLIEESLPLGRLFDIDILDKNGIKLSRTYFRKCIICGQIAHECSRARSHSIEELQQKINDILQTQF